MKNTSGAQMKAVVVLMLAVSCSLATAATNYQSDVDNFSNAEFEIRLNAASALLATAILPASSSKTIFYTVETPVSSVNWNFTAVVGLAATKQSKIIAIEPNNKVNITNYSPKTYVIDIYHLTSGEYQLVNSVTWLG